MKASLVLVQQESISLSIIRGADFRTAFLEGKILECSLRSCFACLLFHSQSSPAFVFFPLVHIRRQQFDSRPTIGQRVFNLNCFRLHRGTAEQRSTELLLAPHVTQSSVKLPSCSGRLGRLKWAELGSKAGTKPNAPSLHILILFRSMHFKINEKIELSNISRCP